MWLAALLLAAYNIVAAWFLSRTFGVEAWHDLLVAFLVGFLLIGEAAAYAALAGWILHPWGWNAPLPKDGISKRRMLLVRTVRWGGAAAFAAWCGSWIWRYHAGTYHYRELPHDVSAYQCFCAGGLLMAVLMLWLWPKFLRATRKLASRFIARPRLAFGAWLMGTVFSLLLLNAVLAFTAGYTIAMLCQSSGCYVDASGESPFKWIPD